MKSFPAIEETQQNSGESVQKRLETLRLMLEKRRKRARTAWDDRLHS